MGPQRLMWPALLPWCDMKQPTKEQLAQLKNLRQYTKVIEYFDRLEEDYVDRLIQENDDTQLRRAQGSLYTIRKLKQLIAE